MIAALALIISCSASKAKYKKEENPSLINRRVFLFIN